MWTRNVYLVETGYLLAKDSIEYEKYSTVYDKKNAYYDNNQSYQLNLTKIIEKAEKLLQTAPANSYIVVTYQCDLENFSLYQDEKETLQNATEEEIENFLNENCFDTGYLSYDVIDIRYSAYKDQNGIIHEDFIRK